MIFSIRKSEIIRKAKKDNFASVLFLSPDEHGKIDKVDVPCNIVNPISFERFTIYSISNIISFKRCEIEYSRGQ